MTQMIPSLTRTLPSSIDAEEGLLACCILDPDVIDRCQEVRLEPDAFHKPIHQTIYEALSTLRRNQIVIDEIALAEELNRAGDFEDIGGFPFLNELTNRVQTTAHANYFAEVVKEKYMLRRLIRENTKAIEAVYAGEKTATEISTEQQSFLSELSGETSKTLQPASETVRNAYQVMRDIRNGDRSGFGIPTGLIDLDKMLRGWKPGKLIILAARPAIGKSSLALTFAAAAAVSKNPSGVLFFTIEMGNEEVAQRLICHQARVPHSRYVDAVTSNQQNIAIDQAAQVLSQSPIWFEERSDINVFDIRATTRRLCKKHDIKVVIVDYLQIVHGVKGDRKSREQEVSEISRNLKSMSKELQVPVIALAQLNRDMEKDKRKPRLSDLRESGSLEQDADIVMFLSRRPDDESVVDLTVAKHRGGSTGEIPLTWIPHFTRFENHANQNL